jgi:oxygen-independent coproporphyrinogen-3 oxidase
MDRDIFAPALLRELASEASRIGRRRLTSVFFGGGTPSLMRPSAIAALIDKAATYFDVSPNIEITLEVNPTRLALPTLADIRLAGVNRVSIGVQSLDDTALRLLGRNHSVEDATAVIRTAQRLFPSVSFDLIYARPNQTPRSWRDELRTALAIAPDHISLYQLTIEPQTVFEGRHRRGELSLPEDDDATAMYVETEAICAKAGLYRYEISNYARPGHESRHNIAYWRYADYAGIGPGAHGRLALNGKLHATRRHRAPEIWFEQVNRIGNGMGSETILDSGQTGPEALLMGLRMHDGIDLTRFRARTGRGMESVVDIKALNDCIEGGYLALEPNRLRATPDGLLQCWIDCWTGPDTPHWRPVPAPEKTYIPKARRYTSSIVSCSSTSAASCLRIRINWRSTFTSNPADFASE